MGTAVAIREVERTGELPAGCGMAGLLETLTRPWMLHIVWLLSTHGPMRFGALRRGADGISARVLTVRLRTLEEKGFVRREVRNSNPPEVTYFPTSQIRDMQQVMELLHSFSAKWQREKDERLADSFAASRSASSEGQQPRLQRVR